MATDEQEQAYIAFMLRLWQVDSTDKLVWRASLERAHPNERIGFSSLDELCHYLYEQTSKAARLRKKIRQG